MKNLLVCFAALGLGLLLSGDIQAQKGGGHSGGGHAGGGHPGGGGYHGGSWGGGYGHGGYYGGGGYNRSYYGSGFYLGIYPGGLYRNYGWGGYGYSPYYSYGYSPSYAYSYPYYSGYTYPYYSGYSYPSYNYGDYYGDYYGTNSTPDTYNYSSAYGPATNQSGSTTAKIEVTLPDPNAQVWVNGQATQTKGLTRMFESPPLEPGRTHKYDLKVTWNQNGQLVTKTREIQVSTGQVTRVDFTKGEGQLGPQGGPYGTGQNPNPQGNPPNLNPNPNPQGNQPNVLPPANQPQIPNPVPPELDKNG